MTFGFSSLVDLLSWTTAALLALKVLATMILLRRDKRTWFASRDGAALWWSTKVTPILAVPCMIAIASIQHRAADARAYAALMLFVLIAVALVVRNRFYRGARTGDPLSSSDR